MQRDLRAPVPVPPVAQQDLHYLRRVTLAVTGPLFFCGKTGVGQMAAALWGGSAAGTDPQHLATQSLADARAQALRKSSH